MGVMGNVTMIGNLMIFQDSFIFLKNHDLNTTESLFRIACSFRNHRALETGKEKKKLGKYFLLMTVLWNDKELFEGIFRFFIFRKF